MKILYLILLSFLNLINLAQSCSPVFNGFYIGGQLGWVQHNDKTSLSNYNGTALGYAYAANVNFQSTKRNSGFLYGLFTGYGQNINGFYLGCELTIENDNASKDNNYNIGIIFSSQGNVSPTAQANAKTKYERGIAIGISPRVGKLIDNNHLVYLKLGVEYSRDKVKITVGDATYAGITVPTAKTFTNSTNQFVFLPGIGLEKSFGKIRGRVEYGYNCGAKINVGRSSIKYSAHMLKIGAIYKF